MIYVKTNEGKVDIFSTVAKPLIHDKKSENYTKSKMNYVICITERSGSTMLSSLLKKTDVLGIPEEYINARGVMQKYLRQFPSSDIYQYFDWLRCKQISPNQVFGMKTSFSDFEPLLNEGIVSKLFNPVKFVYLTRRDIVLQAISSYIARCSGQWHIYKSKSDNQLALDDIEYDELRILKLVDKLIHERLQWERFFSLYSIEPLRITYEDVLEDAKNSVQIILAFMGEKMNTQVDLEMSETSKIGGERNQVWADRIRAKYVL